MNIIEIPKSQLSDFSFINDISEVGVQLETLNLPENRIILLTGDHGVGKDVWASIISHVSPDHRIIRFADPLRQAFKEAGFDGCKLDRLKRTDYIIPKGIRVQGEDVGGLTVRQALVYVAEDVIKVQHGQDFFAIKAMERIRNHLQEGKSVVVPDLRFLVEYEFLENIANGFNIKIKQKHIPDSLPAIVVI